MQLNIKKINNPVKSGWKTQTLLQRKHADGQKAYEKMLNITKYQINANQNTSKNGH